MHVVPMHIALECLTESLVRGVSLQAFVTCDCEMILVSPGRTLTRILLICVAVLWSRCILARLQLVKMAAPPAPAPALAL